MYDMETLVEETLEEVMGPEDERSNEKPSFNKASNKFTGGWSIERSKRMSKTPKRAYTMGLSLEKQRNVVAPAASNKIMAEDANIHTHLDMNARFIKV